MTMLLTNTDLKRLNKLNAGPGNRKGLYTSGPEKYKITIKQIQYIKKLQDCGVNRPEIMKRTGLSHHIVTGAMEDRYDHLLKRQSVASPEPNTTHK